MATDGLAASPVRQVQSMPHQRLDRDPSRLTTFPIPGFMASTFQTREPISEGGGQPVASPVKTKQPPLTTGNQFWMPDNLCKVCYDCGTAFSFFRRRHHCRLCGQIFCHDCSNHFVDGQTHGFIGPIRVCSFCEQYVNGTDKKLTIDQNAGNSIGSINSNDTQSDDIGASTGTITNSGGSSRDDADRRTNLIALDFGGVRPSPLVFGPDPSTAAAPAIGAESPSMLPSPTDSSEDSDSAVPRLELPSKLATADEDGSVKPKPADLKLRSRPTASRWRRSSRELIGAIQSGGLLDAELKAIRKRKMEKESANDAEPSAKDPSAQNAKDLLLTQREKSLDRYMRGAHLRIRHGISHAVQEMAPSLLATSPMDLGRLARSLEDIAFVVAGHLLFSMNFRSANGFNYSNLVKVKSIAAADTVQKNVKEKNYHFKWLAGTVFRKHVSHKQMARQISNPRILLFACGISYDRSNGSGRLSSLDTLLEQEKSYMGILVDKISALEPDVIFVEKTVSRYAQELLRERHIVIVLNVKREMLDRIARHTGAVLLTSVDHVDMTNPSEVVGTCRSFQVKTIPTVPEDDPLPVAKPEPRFLSVMKGASKEHTRLRTETFLYLDGCDPLNGCTVLITGLSKKKLRLLKRLTRGVLSMTYRLLLEAHVLSDLDLRHHMLATRESIEPIDNENTTWCTTCTLRVRESGNASPRYHQCVESKHLGILTYSDNDISFGNFLNQEMAALSLKCQNVKCNNLMADHVHSFSCRNGTVSISFEELPDRSKLSMHQSSENASMSQIASEKSIGAGNESEINVLSMLASNPLSQAVFNEAEDASHGGQGYPPIIFWRWCRDCNGVVTSFIPMEKYIYKYSFARFLEILFSENAGNQPSKSPSASCQHTALESHVLFFNIGNRVARFDFARKVPLHLSRVDFHFKGSVSPPSDNGMSTAHTTSIEKVQARLDELSSLLELVISLFLEKIRGIDSAIEALQQVDKEHYGRIVLEVMCLAKLVKAGQATYEFRLAQINREEQPSRILATCDAIQRSLYLLACKWIACMQHLRKLTKAYLTKGKGRPAQSPGISPAGSFTLGGVTFNVPVVESPRSALRASEEPMLTPSEVCKTPEFADIKDRPKRGGSDATSINGEERSPKSIISSMSTTTESDLELSKISSASMISEKSGNTKAGAELKEIQQPSWKTALWDLYRALGRSTTGSDFSVSLPDTLAAGHPSLPHRWKDRVILVNNAVPITLVAYALSSDSYEEQLDAWKLAVHRENAAAIAADSSRKDHSDSLLPISTNWSRAALTSSLSTPFKLSVPDVPLHLSLLTEESSLSLWNASWDLSTVAYYPLQFEVLRELFFGSLPNFLLSISHVDDWKAKGGKSGASFYRSLDDRFVIKHISSTEMQSFLEVLPGYFKYMSKIYFNGEESILSKTVGLYQTTITRKDSGQKVVQNICVMENAFFRKQLKQTYDLKGSSRNRYAKDQASGSTPTPDSKTNSSRVLLDGDFVEFTKGHPLGIFAEDHEFVLNAVKNDTKFLGSSNIVDYSMIVGMGLDGKGEEKSSEMTVGIIDYMRQFDIIKRMESVGKSVGMIAGKSSPTIVEPGLYGKRFSDAIKRYFMPVTPISSEFNDDR